MLHLSRIFTIFRTIADFILLLFHRGQDATKVTSHVRHQHIRDLQRQIDTALRVCAPIVADLFRVTWSRLPVGVEIASQRYDEAVRKTISANWVVEELAGDTPSVVA